MTNTHTVPDFKGYVTLSKNDFKKLASKVNRNYAMRLAKKYGITPDKEWVADDMSVNAIAYDSLRIIFLEGLQ